MASKGLWLLLALLFLLSSLIFAAATTCLKTIINKYLPYSRASLLAGLAIVGISDSIVLKHIITSYYQELMVWETLSIILSTSNMYGFIAIWFSDLGINNLHIYIYMNTITLIVIPWILVNL